jgi:hypothetical protein
VVDFPLIGPTELASGRDSRVASAEPRLRPGELMDQALLDRYAPASALIDPRCRVHYLRGPTEEYLRPPRGEPSFDLLAMARDGLHAALRMAVRRAIEEGREIATHARVRRGGSLHPVQVIVTPLRGAVRPRDGCWSASSNVTRRAMSPLRPRSKTFRARATCRLSWTLPARIFGSRCSRRRPPMRS